MRKLTYLVLLLAAIYSGYWFIGAAAVSKGIDTQIAAMQADGWSIETRDLTTKGYPSRFDTSASDLVVATPDQNLIWRAPFVQVNALSYKPNQVIAVFPNSQELEIDGNAFEIASDGLKASGAFAASTALDLANLTVQTGPLSVDTVAGTIISISNGIAALRPAGPTPNTYDAYIDLDDLILPEALRRVIDPNGTLPTVLTQATIDGQITLDRTLDRHALTRGELPLIDALTLDGMTFSWGRVQLFAKGALTIDQSGIPTGQITLNLQNWQQFLDIAVNAGAIDTGLANTIRSVAGMLSGGSNDISIPVSFQNGMMSAGPLPIGPAPRFR